MCLCVSVSKPPPVIIKVRQEVSRGVGGCGGGRSHEFLLC